MSKSNLIRVDKWTVFKRLESMGIKKGELAQELGVSPQTVNARWRTGWDKSSLLHLCDILQIAPSEITLDSREV